MELPAFKDALKRLEAQITAPNGDGKPLVSARTLRYWRADKLPPPLLLLVKHPDLLAALVNDMERVETPDPA